MPMSAVNAQRAQFDRDGFYLFRVRSRRGDARPPPEASDASLAEQDEQRFADQVATGSMIMVNGAEFFAYPPILMALASLGFHGPKFRSRDVAALLRPLEISYHRDAEPIETNTVTGLE